MASPYAVISEEIYSQISSRLQGNPEDRDRFAAKGTAKEVLTSSLLRQFFRALDLSETSTAALSDLDEDHLLERIFDRDLYDFLATLIYITCNIHAARSFVTELLVKDVWSENSYRLPVERRVLQSLFRDQITIDKFLDSQACFCAIVICKGRNIVIKHKKRVLLPYLDERPLGEGSFGKVFKVKIARGHLYDPIEKSINQSPREVVRKDYKINDKVIRHGQSTPEHEILNQIFSAVNKCGNIVPILGSLTIGSEDYSLFMPLAKCDLWEYMTDTTRRPLDKPRMILAAQGLANGLDFLHNGIKDKEGNKLVCYHMDLKPANILVFLNKVDDNIDYIWKISDFGLSKIKESRTDTTAPGGYKGRYFKSVFVQRALQDPSGTLSRRKEATYLAPESQLSDRSMGKGSDLWSLACIISILFVYLENGADGVKHYSDERSEHPKSEGYDRFYIRERFQSYQVNPVVKRTHSTLITKANTRDRFEGAAVKMILETLESCVFIHHTKRCTADFLEKALGETYQVYKNLKPPLPGDRPSSKDLWILDKLSNFKRRRQYQKIKRANPICILEEADPFKGCDIAPNGSVIAFWTDFKLSYYTEESVYKAESLQSAEPNGPPGLAPAKGTFSIDHSIWKSVSVTDKYLVASVSSASFECYLFDLRPVRRPNDFHPRKIYLDSIPEIKQLAISPGNKNIAFILRDRDDEGNPGSLYVAPINDISDCRRVARLDWPAANTMRLLFATENDVWIVFRPDQQHKISIFHICLYPKRLDPLTIEFGEHDTLSTVGVFTALAPFHTKPDKCAIIVRRETLYIENLNFQRSVFIATDIHNYLILRLMIASDDSRLIALGKRLTSYKMLLLEMSLPSREDRRTHIKELAELPGLSEDDDFTERLCFEQGENVSLQGNFVLLAAFTKEKKRVVYRVEIQ